MTRHFAGILSGGRKKQFRNSSTTYGLRTLLTYCQKKIGTLPVFAMNVVIKMFPTSIGSSRTSWGIHRWNTDRAMSVPHRPCWKKSRNADNDQPCASHTFTKTLYTGPPIC